jgi:DNA-binding MarR family transcriptional regulator
MQNKIKFHFRSPGESPGFLLWQVTMLWQRKIKRGLDKLGITHTQFVLLATLAWLSKEKEVITQIDIANHSKTDRMMVSKILRKLQMNGYVSRREHETDTRAKVVTLSETGKKLVQKALKIVEQADVDFFSGLGSRAQNFNHDMELLIQNNS